MRTRNLAAQRGAAVLVWVPVLMARPVADAPRGARALLTVAGVLLGAGACLVAVVDSWPAPTRRSGWAWVALALVTLACSACWTAWSQVWVLVAMTAGAALTTRQALLAIPMTALATAATASRFAAVDTGLLEPAFVVALAGTTTAVISRLLITNDMLGRTREQLAVAAVAHERDRVARDLHDVLGHTLSLMVVKAAAVKRLIHSDPAAAIGHADDIEKVGRSALAEVRRTLSDTAQRTLGGELASAREALAAAGIEVRLQTAPGTSDTDCTPLAWALREGVTNVVRHSKARHCWVELGREDHGLRLTIADDGVGAGTDDDVEPEVDDRNSAGLRGLRSRMAEAGGRLETQATRHGFTLSAWLPDRAREDT